MTIERRLLRLEAQAQPQEPGVVSVVVYDPHTGAYLTPVDRNAIKLILIADDGAGGMLHLADCR